MSTYVTLQVALVVAAVLVGSARRWLDGQEDQMSEQITITVPLEQAEALVDAANCLDVAAQGELAILYESYVPSDKPDTAEANRYLREMGQLARQAAAVLRPAIDEAYKRDPLHQQMLHALRMYRRRGRT